MHYQAYAFVERVVPTLPDIEHVLEIGSRNVNGSVRPLFADAAEYTGVDIQEGLGVDIVVGEYAAYTLSHSPSVVVTCETLEHAKDARGIVSTAAAMLRPGGHLLITCATDPREPHSGVDGGPLRNGEFYRNVTPNDLRLWLLGAELEIVLEEVHADRGDLYALALKAAA